MRANFRIQMSGVPGNARCVVGVGPLNIGVDSKDALSALHAASGIAQSLSKTMADHPELAPLFGPVAGPLNAINIASKAAKEGKWDHIETAMPVAAAVVSNLLKGLL